MATQFPSYDELPSGPGTSHGCAWDLFSRDGEKDVYGCLHKITPDIVRETATEVQDGVSISLNWPMGAIRKPGYMRRSLVHKVISFSNTPLGIHGFDDEVEFNTQGSSQWDSLCHFHHQESASAYNGSQPTIEDLVQEHGSDKGKDLPTLDHWHRRGGLVARGVLVDYVSYAERKGIPYNPVSTHTIRVAEIEEIIKEQGVTLRQGDVILIRTGYTDMVGSAGPDEQEALINKQMSAGVEGSMEAVRWFWNIHCAAVACDGVGFEVCPAAKDGVAGAGGSPDLVLHPHFLGLLGIHMGELWDLKALSEYCQRTGRYTFMLTSVPLNVPGLVGSPPNALAIF